MQIGENVVDEIPTSEQDAAPDGHAALVGTAEELAELRKSRNKYYELGELKESQVKLISGDIALLKWHVTDKTYRTKLCNNLGNYINRHELPLEPHSDAVKELVWVCKKVA